MRSATTLPTEQATPGFLDRHKKWVVAFILFGMYASFGMSWIGVVPLSATINEILGIGPAEGQRLVSIVSMAKSFFPIVAGILAGRWGLTKTMRLSALLMMSSLIIPFLSGYWLWVALKFLFGVGGAFWVTLMGAVTMQVFEPAKRPIINALNGVAITVGVMASYRLTVPLTDMLGSWKMTLTLYNGVSIFFLALLFAVGQLAPVVDRDSSAQAPSLLDTFKAYAGTLKLPVTWLTSIAFAGPLAVYLVFAYWLPVYHKKVLQFTPELSNSLMFWLNMGAVFGAVLTGLLIQRYGKTKPFIGLAAVMIPLTTLLAVYLADKSNPSVLTLIMILAGMALFIPVSPLVTLLQAQPGLTPALVGMILGTMFSITYILSYMAPEIVAITYKAEISLQLVLMLFCVTTVSPVVALVLKES